MRGRTGALAMLAAGLVFLAGCAGGSTADLIVTSSAAPEPVSQLFDGDSGGIEGLVLDDQIAPVGNAKVRLHNTSKDGAEIANTTTGADGKFTFSLLPPATYKLAVEADGFAAFSQLVQVVAAEATKVRYTLGAAPSAEPYIELLIGKGVTGCNFTAVWITLDMGCGLVLDTYKEQIKVHIAETWAYAVAETQWDGQAALWIFGDLDDDGTCISPGQPCPASVMGTSPLRFDAAPLSEHNTSQYQHGPIKFPPPATAFDLWLNFADFGLLYNEINTYGKTVCDLNGYCGGVGMTLEVPFTSYTSIFHHALPPDAAKYSALPDA